MHRFSFSSYSLHCCRGYLNASCARQKAPRGSHEHRVDQRKGQWKYCFRAPVSAVACHVPVSAVAWSFFFVLPLISMVTCVAKYISVLLQFWYFQSLCIINMISVLQLLCSIFKALVIMTIVWLPQLRVFFVKLFSSLRYISRVYCLMFSFSIYINCVIAVQLFICMRWNR